MTDPAAPQATPIRATGVGLLAAVGAALAASICCLGPLVLVSLGATGAWIGSLSALEPYRPLFMIITAGFLGFAFLRVYRPRPQACEPGSACAEPVAKRATKVGLWVVTLVVVGLFVSPYVVGQLAAGTRQAPALTTETATLVIDGMTCDSCTVTVEKRLTRLHGVLDAQVSFDPPRAVVEFDPTLLTSQNLAGATAAVGYPSRITD